MTRTCRHPFRIALIFPLVVLGGLSLPGCSEDKNKTGPGEGGIGAPGAPPANLPQLSEQEQYEQQQKREAELIKESQSPAK